MRGSGKTDEEFLGLLGKEHWAQGGAGYAEREGSKPQSAQARHDVKASKVRAIKEGN